MKKYNVEMRRNYKESFDNWIEDYVPAESKEEAIELAKSWLVENGMDPDDVEELEFQVSEWEMC